MPQMCSMLARTRVLALSRSFTACRHGLRHYSDKPRAPPGVKDGIRNRHDDPFQYDMKAPQLDAGFANVFQSDPNMISITENLTTGFRLSNGRCIYGPILLVNNTPFTLKIPPPTQDPSGKVANPLELLDPDALRLLGVATPKPELLVVGGGANISRLSPRARQYLTSVGLQVELASTRHASSTFNTLAEEGRNAALLAIPAGVCI